MFWKSNAKNLALLERHVVPGAVSTRGGWAFVIVIVLAIVAIAVVPIVVVYWVVHGLLGRNVF